MVEINWDEYAHCYDALRHLIPYQTLQRDIFAALNPQPGEVILEAGCGTGNFTELLAEQTPAVNVYAVDGSTAMLVRAKKKCHDAAHILFVEHDLTTPLDMFADATFETVVSINVLYTLVDPEMVLREWCRVLKPGGRLLLVTPKDGFENGLILKQHLGSTKPDAYWTRLHTSPSVEAALIREAFGDGEIAEQMIHVAACNQIIQRDQTYTFFTEVELKKLLRVCGFSVQGTRLVYAQQNLFVWSKKGV